MSAFGIILNKRRQKSVNYIFTVVLLLSTNMYLFLSFICGLILLGAGINKAHSLSLSDLSRANFQGSISSSISVALAISSIPTRHRLRIVLKRDVKISKSLSQKT